MTEPIPQLLEVWLQGRHRGAPVLLVEDDLINAQVTADLLRLAGLEVDVVHTGERALLSLANRRYALVLMDVRLPGMDGVAATQALRALPGGNQVPVVALTAMAFVGDRRHCLAAGMDDYLTKPVEPAELFATVLRWLEDGRQG